MCTTLSAKFFPHPVKIMRYLKSGKLNLPYKKKLPLSTGDYSRETCSLGFAVVQFNGGGKLRQNGMLVRRIWALEDI